VVSDLGYVVVRWFVQWAVWRGGSPVVLFAHQGQKSLFTSHFLLLHCGEDGVAVRGGLVFVGEYGAPPVMEGALLVHGEVEKEGFPPWLAASLFPPHPLSLPSGNPSRRHNRVIADFSSGRS
jgi:hypothetical protein